MQCSSIKSEQYQQYNYGNIQRGMPVFMDNIVTIESLEEVKSGLGSCARIEVEK